MEPLKAYVALVWGLGGVSSLTYHVAFTNTQDEEAFACGASGSSEPRSRRTLIEWLYEPKQYGNCKRCLKSKLVKRLLVQHAPDLDALRAQKAAERAGYKLDELHRDAMVEDFQREAKRQHDALVSDAATVLHFVKISVQGTRDEYAAKAAQRLYDHFIGNKR